MNYYLRPSFDARIEGPVSLDDINDRLAEGTLDLSHLATPDLGESLKRVQGLPRHDWKPLRHTPEVKGYVSPIADSKMRSLGRALLFVTAIFLISLAITYIGSIIFLGGF
jgi:hypothetical protein